MSKSRLFIWWLGALSAYIAAYAAFAAAGRLGLDAPLPVLIGVAAGIGLIVIMLLFRKLLFLRGPSVVATEVDEDNQGKYEEAAWIIRRHPSAGVQHIDKLTPDGLICGYIGSDTSPGFETVYSVDVGSDEAQRLIQQLDELTAESNGLYQAPNISDGFVLEFRFRRLDDDRRVRLLNVKHPEFFEFCSKVWRYAPDAASDQLDRALPGGLMHFDDKNVDTW